MTTRKLLKHTVTVLLAHIGYEMSSDTALETLTDISEHFLRRMSLLLKVTVEQKDHGFPVGWFILHLFLTIWWKIIYDIQFTSLGFYGESPTPGWCRWNNSSTWLLSGLYFEIWEENETWSRHNGGGTAVRAEHVQQVSIQDHCARFISYYGILSRVKYLA